MYSTPEGYFTTEENKCDPCLKRKRDKKKKRADLGELPTPAKKKKKQQEELTSEQTEDSKLTSTKKKKKQGEDQGSRRIVDVKSKKKQKKTLKLRLGNFVIDAIEIE